MVKLAYIGGSSLFVPSILNGIAGLQRRLAEPVEEALYDISSDAASPMAQYGGVLARAWEVPLHVSVCSERDQALAGADVVLVSVWLHEHEHVRQLQERLGFELAEEGPQVAAWAAACAPWSLGVAEDMRRLCPQALLLTVMNPTDVLAGYLSQVDGVRCAGMCVEVDGLRGALAYYCRMSPDEIVLHHAGVNHDG